MFSNTLYSPSYILLIVYLKNYTFPQIFSKIVSKFMMNNQEKANT